MELDIMRLSACLRSRVPFSVAVALFAAIGAALSPAFAEGWRHNRHVAAGARTRAALERVLSKDSRFGRITFTSGTSGSTLLGGGVDSLEDLLALRSVVNSTAPEAPVRCIFNIGGRDVPDNFFYMPMASFERWLETPDGGKQSGSGNRLSSE